MVDTARAQKQYGPGVSDTEIKIGNTTPYSGPASVYNTLGLVETGYFQMINDQGGVNGRKINFISLDDAYSPPKTVEVTRRLVEQDNVLAIYGSLGTPTNVAIHRYLNAKKVPHLFPNTGSSKWNDPTNFPWTVGLLPSYFDEMRIYARHLLQTKPDAKVAVLYQNDDYGKDHLNGFKDGLGAKAASMIVAQASYEVSDPTVDSQIIQLKASGADTVIHMSQVRFAALSLRKVYESGWRPTQYLAAAGASLSATFQPIGLEKAAGVISSAYYKEPSDPAMANDAEYLTYLAFMKTFVPEEDPSNAGGAVGYLFGQALVMMLKACGDQLTRENLIKQATSLKNVPLAMLLPGITLNTSAANFGAVQQLRMRFFDGKSWQNMGDVVSAR